MSYSEELRLAAGTLEIRDVFELLSEYGTESGISIEAGDADEWGELIAEELRQSRTVPQYDTVLVDEAQDMRGWALALLENLGGSEATVCVAKGTGQELYGDASDWLSQFETSARLRRLNRNFRNTRPVFQLAYTFYETRLNPDKITAALGRFSQKSKQTELLFERPDGQLPMLCYVDESDLRDFHPGDFMYGHRQRELMVREYRRLIEEQLGTLESTERPIDLLILVPSERSHSTIG
jgi:ATP-dependent exoDNAse (exonuclease V) beta subunit